MTAQDQQSREAFEQSAKEIWPEMNIVRGHYGGYLDFNTHDKWLMWQAARALPEGMEPVECQWRMRPDWDNKHPWTDWAKCSPASAAAYERTPILHNWIYEVRRFYAAAQVLAMGRVPPGWQAVPVEPTSKQVVLMASAIMQQETGTSDTRHPLWLQFVEQSEKAYRAALQAAPPAPAGMAVPESKETASVDMRRVFLVVQHHAMKGKPKPIYGHSLCAVLSAHVSFELAESARSAAEEAYHEEFPGYRRYGDQPMYLWAVQPMDVVGSSAPAQEHATQLAGQGQDETMQALSDLTNALRERHHGRMPEEVQRAYDKAWAIVFAGPHAAAPIQAQEDARDAARYRWLREGNPGCYNTIMIYAGAHLDAATDAAMAAQRVKREEAEGVIWK